METTLLVKNLRAAGAIGLVLLVIITFWYLLWKFILEPNPLIRDFFDLDLKSSKPPPDVKNLTQKPKQAPGNGNSGLKSALKKR